MRPLIPALLLTAALLPASAVQARDVDVSLSLGFAQPGLVGRVDIGRPYVYYPRPVYLAPQPVYVMPVHPRKHRHHKHWRRDCYRYGDCGHAYAAPAYRYGPPVVVYRD